MRLVRNVMSHSEAERHLFPVCTGVTGVWNTTEDIENGGSK